MPHQKWKRRDEKLRKEKQGMQISGRSIFTLQEIIRRRAEQARHEKKQKPVKRANE